VQLTTLANLEQGRGNPTIETLWSLALGLGVAFSDLIEDRSETTTVVVRAKQGARVLGSTQGGKLDLRLLDRVERGGLVEVFAMFLPARTEHLGSPHGSGVVERVFVHEGTITVGPASDPLTLGPGDYARYSGDGRTSTVPRTRTATACCWSATRLPRERRCSATSREASCKVTRRWDIVSPGQAARPPGDKPQASRLRETRPGGR
jgi:transcriptional regulator with XRE-family HTH domain